MPTRSVTSPPNCIVEPMREEALAAYDKLRRAAARSVADLGLQIRTLEAAAKLGD